MAGVEAERLRQSSFHERDIGGELRAFKPDGRVNVHNRIAGVLQQFSDVTKEEKARDAAPFGRSVGEMPADVAQRGSAEQRVAYGMRQRIAVRVAYRTFREGDVHSAQDELVAANKAVQVVPDAGANGSQRL